MVKRVNLQIGDLVLDVGTRRLAGPDGIVHVTGGRYAALENLMSHPGRAVTHDALISGCWPNPENEPDSANKIVQIYIHDLRKILKRVGSTVYLRTSWGLGYLIEEEKGTIPLLMQLSADNIELRKWCRALERGVVHMITRCDHERA